MAPELSSKLQFTIWLIPFVLLIGTPNSTTNTIKYFCHYFCLLPAANQQRIARVFLVVLGLFSSSPNLNYKEKIGSPEIQTSNLFPVGYSAISATVTMLH